MKKEGLWSKIWGPAPEKEEQKPDYPKIPLEAMIEVLDLNNQLLFVGRVSEYTRGIVTIREASDQEVPPVFYNTEVKLRYFYKAENLVLHGMICGSTPYVWRVDRLESQFTAQQRSAFRQRVRLSTCVAPQEKPAGKDGEMVLGKQSQCELMDISVGGLLMKCRESFEEGQILVFPELRVMPEEEPYRLVCRVCWVKEDSRVYSYGCAFQGLSEVEQDRLLRDIFAVQRVELQEKKNRGL